MDMRIKLKEKISRELELYGGIILDSDEMNQAFGQTHHTRSTVAEHTIRVAKKSLTICHFLEKLHIYADIPAVVKGALCHDLGILGRDEKYSSEKECCRRHPADSVEVAQKLLDELPDKTRDVIEHHMWPTAGSKMPAYLEGFIVSAADKAAAVEDFFKGSSVMPADLKTTLLNIAERSRIKWKTKKEW